MARSYITKDVRESYLDDVQILRNRGLSVDHIADELSSGERQIDRRQVQRWVTMLKNQRRWRHSIKEMKTYELSGMAKVTHESRNERFRAGR